MQLGGSEVCVSFLFTYDSFDCIIAIFVFYARWARARCKVFTSVTSGWEVMAVPALLNQSEVAII